MRKLLLQPLNSCVDVLPASGATQQRWLARLFAAFVNTFPGEKHRRTEELMAEVLEQDEGVGNLKLFCVEGQAAVGREAVACLRRAESAGAYSAGGDAACCFVCSNKYRSTLENISDHWHSGMCYSDDEIEHGVEVMPFIFPCGHSMCLDCMMNFVEQWVDGDADAGGSALVGCCKMCRDPLIWTARERTWLSQLLSKMLVISRFELRLFIN
eukprot:g16805.t1